MAIYESSPSVKKVFRPVHKRGRIFSAIAYTFLALFLLSVSVAKWNIESEGILTSWWNSWPVFALCFVAYGFIATQKWNEIFFVRLLISKEGICYYRLGNTRFIPWEQVERVGVLQSPAYGNPEYGFILFNSPDSENKRLSLFEKLRTKRTIPLSVFVDEWFVSELRSEIKRLNPGLPVQ